MDTKKSTELIVEIQLDHFGKKPLDMSFILLFRFGPCQFAIVCQLLARPSLIWKNTCERVLMVRNIIECRVFGLLLFALFCCAAYLPSNILQYSMLQDSSIKIRRSQPAIVVFFSIEFI